MNRRNFLKNTMLTGVAAAVSPKMVFSKDASSCELLYNGITLPKVWPPKNMDPDGYNPMPVPYLANPPEVIPIDVGRQLFVDDFLIEETTLRRTFHNAQKLDHNPILQPETDLEKAMRGEKQVGNPAAVPKDGGVWWDPKDNVFKMWYEAGWLLNNAYAISSDGVNWERPELGIEQGTNRILPYLTPDSTTVFLDHFASNPQERFKMLLSPPQDTVPGQVGGWCMVSPDGIHWSTPIETGVLADRSTVFYNPFRDKWVYSIRSSSAVGKSSTGRARFYREHSDFLNGAQWNKEDLVFWAGADHLDVPDPEIGQNAQLYNLSAVGYESLMLGLHEIHLGPPNRVCEKTGRPKLTELKVSFSRDGFHWDRPNRDAFISATRKKGDWDRGYVQSVGGICTVVGDELWFYYSGFKGNPDRLEPDKWQNGMYYGGSTGIATLRRDGFASMAARGQSGTLTTRPITFKGRNLFVNVDCPKGELKVEILGKDHAVLTPFSVNNCLAVSEDSTITEIRWKNEQDLLSLIGKEVRFKFYLEKGKLFSFWVSPEKSGASHGFNAAGGPGFKGGKDLEGMEAYKQARSFQLG